MKYVNPFKVNPILAVVLLHSDYEYVKGAYSATTLIKPIQALTTKISNENTVDLLDMVPSVSGNLFHALIEKVWRDKKTRNKILKSLGINRKYYIDPSPKKLKKIKKKFKSRKMYSIIYMERRNTIKILGTKITGKFDRIVDGKIFDTKNLKTFKYAKLLEQIPKYHEIQETIKPNSLDFVLEIEDLCPDVFDYAMQLSIYRILFPDLIEEDSGVMELIFKDYSNGFRDFNVKRNTVYPPSAVVEMTLPLFTKKATIKYIKNKLKIIKRIQETDELPPECTPAQLWMDPPIYKYFSNPNNKVATRNFKEDAKAAYDYLLEKKVGEVKVVTGKAKRCLWCTVRMSCAQAKVMAKSGMLDLSDLEK